MLILIPLPWMVAWLLAALVHEFFHCITTVLFGKHIYSLVIGMNGAQIQTEPLSESESLLCALAGPFGGLLLILSAPVFPRLAVCALFQTVFNLLPVYPLDGGRALFNLTKLFMREKTACKLCGAVKFFALVILIVFGALAAVWNFGLLPLLLALVLTLRMMKIKIPCK